MKHLLVFIILIAMAMPSLAANQCVHLFSLKGANALSITSIEEIKAIAEISKSIDEGIQKHAVELEKAMGQYADYQGTRRLAGIFAFMRKLSGNSLESEVRLQRIRLGERFYRLMRAGNVVRATNYIRDLMTSVRSSAEIVYWAREELVVLEARLQSGQLDSAGVRTTHKWVEKLQEIIRRETKFLSKYGDVQMIVYQLERLKIMYNTEIDQRMRTSVAAAAEKFQEMALEGTRQAQAVIARTQEEMANDLGVRKQTPEELEKHINERITDVTERMYNLGGLRTLFPHIFKDAPSSTKVERDPILQSIREGAVFIGMVFHSKNRPGAYGAALPVRAVLAREIAWEIVAVLRNATRLITRNYASLMRVISRSNIATISSDAKARAEAEQSELQKIQQVIGEQATQQVKVLAGRANAFNLVTRKALQWILDDMTKYEAITDDSPRIDMVESFLRSYFEGFQTRPDFVENLSIIALSGDRSNYSDFSISFARIRDYREEFNRALEVVREEAEATAKRFPHNPNANFAEMRLLKAMVDAQEAVKNGSIAEIGLSAEVNLVATTLKQIAVFGGGTSISAGGALYMISPETFQAIVGVFGNIMPF